MSDTIIRKSLFGGFNRIDVLEKIESLQQQNKELSDINDSNIDELNRLKKIETEYNLLLERINTLTSENEFLVKKSADLDIQIEKKDVEYNSLKAEYDKAINEICSKPENTPQLSTSSNELIKNAMSYSDKIIETAKEDAKDIYSKAKNELMSTKLNVVEISDKIRTVGSNLSYSVSSINACLESLSYDLEQMEKSLMVTDNE